MFEIQLRAVKSSEMRVEGAGDYYEKDGVSHIVVCDLGNWKYTALLMLHELCEYFLVKAFNVPLQAIDDFDSQFEMERRAGQHGIHDEPGDEPDAPYHIQHGVATCVERAVAAAMFINWREYSNIVDNLVFPRKHTIVLPRRRGAKK